MELANVFESSRTGQNPPPVPPYDSWIRAD